MFHKLEEAPIKAALTISRKAPQGHHCSKEERPQLPLHDGARLDGERYQPGTIDEARSFQVEGATVSGAFADAFSSVASP